MVLLSAAEGQMTDSELGMIGRLVNTLPVFKDFRPDSILDIGKHVAELLQKEQGVDELLGEIKKALSIPLRETAYCLACDVVAADGKATAEELELLSTVRDWLELDQLVAAAIERAARARYRHHA